MNRRRYNKPRSELFYGFRDGNHSGNRPYHSSMEPGREMRPRPMAVENNFGWFRGPYPDEPYRNRTYNLGEYSGGGYMDVYNRVAYEPEDVGMGYYSDEYHPYRGSDTVFEPRLGELDRHEREMYRRERGIPRREREMPRRDHEMTRFQAHRTDKEILRHRQDMSIHDLRRRRRG